MLRNIQNLESVFQAPAGIQHGTVAAGLEFAPRAASRMHRRYSGKRPSDSLSSRSWRRGSTETRCGCSCSDSSDRMRPTGVDSPAIPSPAAGSPPASVWARLVVARALAHAAAV